jgi:hypothetical protein
MSAKGLLTLLLILTCMIYPLRSFGQDAANDLSITVMQGQGESIDERHIFDVVVRVSAVGANVTFKLPPESGVSLPGGASQISVKTDGQGFARSGVLSPTGKGDAFDLEVVATYEGKNTSALVHLTNASTSTNGAAAAAPHKSHKMIWIGVIGAAAAAGIILAAKSGGSSSDSSSSTVNVSAGSPTIGPPQ